MAKPLSVPQEAVLRNLVAGRDPAYHLVGRSTHGGHWRVMAALLLKGYIGQRSGEPIHITAAGRAAIEDDTHAHD